MNKIFQLTIIFLLGTTVLFAQPDRWQQAIDYKMDIDFDVKTHRFTGKQKVVYTNNSPDELNKVFYHLYFNAFQPGSMMDMRNQSLQDADRRVAGRISKLKDDEIGYHKIISLRQNGKAVAFEVVGTVLEVKLNDPIGGGGKSTFDMEFVSQVPVQIRRSGRHNKEGIDYSMSQWFPKMCEYDYQGWHANPYVGREFYGVWGDFDVKINIDRSYIIGATGYLQNPNQIGYGYEDEGVAVKPPRGEKLTWHFKAPNVHDFVWAADPDYTHVKMKADAGHTMHFLFQKNENTEGPWSRLPNIMNHAFNYINKTYGEYPYQQYSFIQGGDGGMEYPMATLITGERHLGSLVGVSAHELMHSWYQMILGTNESLYAWMDEGFTSYATSEVMNELKKQDLLPGMSAVENPHSGTYASYGAFALSGREEALSIHADHFTSNAAYGVGAYVKGQVFLKQLEYVIGKDAFDSGLLKYYNTWKFKHPNANDFIRIMEKESGLELDWYREYFVNTTHTIDYGVNEATKADKKQTRILLEKTGVMPMPIDMEVTLNNGEKIIYNIPLRIMRGHKKQEDKNAKFEVLEDWPWTHPTYEAVIPVKFKKVKSIRIDPHNRMADVVPGNNKFELVKP